MLTIILVAFVVTVGTYTLAMFAVGLKQVPDPDVSLAERRQFVVMIPCLNEELVIHRTLDRLLGPGAPENLTVMVIDDGSDDHTAEIAEAYPSDKVRVFRRTAPDAQQGKGKALNAAYRELRDTLLAAGGDPSTLIVGVLDADGRLEVNKLPIVDKIFNAPSMGAVQIKVSIHNATDGILARCQDIEFATFTEIFQRARAHLGSSGLGGNGQFTRLSALMELGDEPWSECLTEDLELGINFLLRGWDNEFTPDVTVSQQGIVELKRLVRQRSRWFQGHLQCLHLVKRIMKSTQLSLISRVDLSYHIVNSLLMLFFQTISVLWIAITAVAMVMHPDLTELSTSSILTLYALAFGLVPIVAVSYHRSRPQVGWLRCIIYAHAYVLYTYMWFAAGIRAVYNFAKGQHGWAKTTRTVGTGDETPVVTVAARTEPRQPVALFETMTVPQPGTLTNPASLSTLLPLVRTNSRTPQPVERRRRIRRRAGRNSGRRSTDRPDVIAPRQETVERRRTVRRTANRNSGRRATDHIGTGHISLEPTTATTRRTQ